MGDKTNAFTTRYPTWVTAMLALAALFGLFISYHQYASTRRSSGATIDDAAQVQKWAREIVQARHRPRVASLEVEPPDRISRRVDVALSAAEIRPSSLLSVDPQAPSRVGRTAYQLRATQMVLQDLTLKQVILFSSALRDAENGMTVRDLSLTPRTNPLVQEEHWNVRLTLTQMIFSPISDL
ncbi:hypothetical protein CA13_40330 [Planctomycetes bacterium CA13]|uniref:Uncharacterized protein n=1 Tax=Novipirellula herctigrandis TaxID=2527986 RepID=A0A5C5Z5W3_9BACT|nr:hypothetical protein CA13_40330 [Planctomycetes bacterium CA13]